MILLHVFCNIVGKKNRILKFLKSVVNMAELLLGTFVTSSFVTVHVIVWMEGD